VSHRTDPGSLYRRRVTRQWWAEQALRFELVTSQATVDELAEGSYPGQGEAIALIGGIPRLEVDEEAQGIAEVYIRHYVMPDEDSGDALHLALASIREVDYLLTWNLRHLANPNKVEHIATINRRLGLLTPVILSPEQLWAEEEP
jgi:hypothetical protein